MPAAYSADIRGRVIARVESGSRDARPRISLRSARVQQSDGFFPRAIESQAGQAARREHVAALEKHTDFLLALIEEQPDLTLDEIVCAMRKQKNSGQSHVCVALLQAS